jgi:hypothetical protein|tara:strand:- start:32 stop:421 length:390 start_codon:yes stop_codon:yes gene_type:complete
MNKLQFWEFGVLILVVIIAFVISLLFKQEIVESPLKDASDEDIIDFAYRSADESACDYIVDEARKNNCISGVEDKKFLNEGIEKTNQELPGASSDDKRFLGKALISKDSSFCEQIEDEYTKIKCLEVIS